MKIGKILIEIGLIFVILGIIAIGLGTVHLRLFRLPGDIVIKRDNFVIYIPITTSIILSIVATLILSILFKK